MMNGDWVILLAERQSWSLPVDRIERTWREVAEQYLWHFDLSIEAIEEVSRKIRAACGVNLSRFEVEVFICGASLVQILWNRYNRFRKITEAIYSMVDWEIAAELTRKARQAQGALLLVLGRRRARLKLHKQNLRRPRRFVEWEEMPPPVIGESRPYFVGVRYGEVYERYLAPKKGIG